MKSIVYKVLKPLSSGTSKGSGFRMAQWFFLNLDPNLMIDVKKFPTVPHVFCSHLSCEEHLYPISSLVVFLIDYNYNLFSTIQ